MRVVFWGTPDFGVPTLEAILHAGHDVVGVVTNPDRPRGRGRRLQPSAVKTAALDAGLHLLQPERPKGDEFLRELAELEPEISVVAAYGHILVDEVLGLPTHGSVNVHASLLPQLRGAAPVNWAIIRGHRESGVTIMRMVREMDAGSILLQAAIPIDEEMTAGKLYERAAALGAPMTVEVLAAISGGTLTESEQDDALATYAPKLGREDARLEWVQGAIEVANWIRGCDPWPGAWSELEGIPVQLFEPHVTRQPATGDGAELAVSTGAELAVSTGADIAIAPGMILAADPRSGLEVAAGRGSVRIGAVKPAGARRMSAAAWIRGRGAGEGGRFV
jgi:methionyl-tRNA formyltransferase